MDENRDGKFDYTFDNPNFNFLQFRTNLVIRWEYKPGSTLYLVWSQGRDDLAPTGRLAFRDDVTDLFGAHPHNIVLIKVNHWFSW